MDKIRPILEYVLKYHFWLLCCVAIVAGLIGWFMARGRLSEEYAKGKSNVVSKFDALRQIQQEEFPPNNAWKEGIDKLTEEERQKVKDAWQTVYDEQQKVLEWPPVMGPDFKNVVMNWVRKADPTADFDSTLRGSYRDRVVNVEFPKLPAIVEARPLANDKDGAANPGNPAGAPADDVQVTYKVEWVEESQQKVKQTLAMSLVGVPSSFAVWLKQEDLWVFRALLNIVRNTNEGALYTSRIKRIEALSIGVDAAKEFQNGMRSGKIDRVQTAGGEEAPAEAAVAYAADDEKVEKPLDDGRYVDQDGNPLAGGTSHTVQFKRMPIHLRLVMDQREIPRLLTECANSPLPVEVSQLRINAGSEKSEPGKPGAAPRGAAAAGNAAPSPTAPDLYDVTVEINGIVSIYNPPDASKLGQGDTIAAGGG